MSTPSKMQLTASISNPLLHAGLLELTLNLVGTGEAIFLRAVNRSWKACYDRLIVGQQADEEEHIHTSICTSYQAVFASASRVRLADHSGLLFAADNSCLQYCAGKYAAISTLAAAHDLGLPFSQHLMQGAARSRCLAKLQWLHTEQQCPLPDDITAAAAKAGDVETLRWLKIRGSSFTQQTSRSGARTANNLHVLQFLHDEGCPWDEDICGAAGKAGDLEQLKWLHAHGATLNDRTADIAAEGGAVHVLEWLQQQQGIEISETTMTFAAMHGHLQLCQWLRAQQCPWDGSTTTVAALGTNCDVLRWLIESGCPQHALGQHVYITAVRAFRGNNFSILQYLYECGILAQPDALTDALNAAGAHGLLAVEQWLRQRGAEWPAVLRFGGSELSTGCPWHSDTLAWARAEGCTSPTA
jgi:hypothetical protein